MTDAEAPVAEPQGGTPTELLGSLVALGRLTAGIAHDFNNLLTILLVHLDQLRVAEGSERAQLLDSLEAALRPASHLTARLVALARQEAPGRSAASSTAGQGQTDLGAVAAEVGNLLRHTRDPRVILEVRAASGVPPVRAEPGLLTQMLLNLCLNAYDAMPQGGNLVIEIEQGAADRETAGSSLPPVPEVRLRVRDSGAGIVPENQERIFESFFTTKKGRQNAGLGLSIVADIMRQLGGRIACHSSPGQGTCFEVFLPVAAEEPAIPKGGASEALPARTDPPAPSPLSTGTVLVVENDPIVRRLAKTVLERTGYAVLLAEDGREAVETYRRERHRIAVVLLDWIMPVLSGLDALAELRRINPDVPIVLTSGGPLEAEYLPLPADTSVQQTPVFLPKPYRTVDLLAAVAEALDRGNRSVREPV